MYCPKLLYDGVDIKSIILPLHYISIMKTTIFQLLGIRKSAHNSKMIDFVTSTGKMKNVYVSPITSEQIQKVEKILSNVDLKPFKGTLKLHQYTWNKKNQSVIQLNSISCFICCIIIFKHRICLEK